MNNQVDLDNELADMTDKLLTGADAQVSAELAAEAEVVRQLYRTMNATPDAAFRAQLTRRLNEEWETVFRPQGISLTRFPRILALAAVLVLILFVVGIYAVSQGGVATPVGTVLGGSIGPVVVVVAVLLLGAVGLWLWRHRN